MKKKTMLILVTVCSLVVLAGAITFANCLTPEDKMIDMMNQVENALGDERKKQTVTKVSDLVYSDNEGNTIIYHICITTYYKVDSTAQTGLNTDAIATVIDPDEAQSCREYIVSNLPAAIYQKDGRAYLCWTIIPELSCVIEYDPTIQNEEDMLHMAESVPANTVNSPLP